MNTKRTPLIMFLSVCLMVLVAVSLLATSARASDDGNSIVHESADIFYYENGAPYIHDILTNHTDKTIIETQYCMLAYDENGFPLELYWNFLDSSAESSFENIVKSEEHILPNQTEEYHGGWSLYNEETNQVAYSLLCLKQVVFEDGSIWNHPDYEDWSERYIGKEISVDELQNYYPYQYHIALD